MKKKHSKTEQPCTLHSVKGCAFQVGDKIQWNKNQRYFRGDCFTGGKRVETVVKIDYSPKPKETKLWMTNGLHINPECVEHCP